jgi:hypothetical protein
MDVKKRKMENNQEVKKHDFSRRKFLELGTAGAAYLGFASIAIATPSQAEPLDKHASMKAVSFEKREPRIAVIGTGGRGTSLLGNLLDAGGNITAICDIVAEKAEHAAIMVVAAGQKQPKLYINGPRHYEELAISKDVDFVLIATPWNWHVPMALAVLESDKDVGLEVPACTTINECWQLVRASERSRRHCMMLENCCYDYNETLVLRMIQAGEFGKLLYGEGAYLHDLRSELFSGKGEGLWRRAEHTRHNGNLYPTHGLGPVANYMSINHGDSFAYLVSMSTLQLGLDLYRKDHLKSDDSRWNERYICGDMNTSLIKTAKGLTITVKHTVSTPHPYSRVNMIAGTHAIFEDYPPRIYVDGMNANESYGSLDAFKKYEHPLWTRNGEIARKSGGHGGMDYIMLARLLDCIRKGLPPDIDVYDTASWSAVGPVSIESVAHGSAPVRFPDFYVVAGREMKLYLLLRLDKFRFSDS